MKILNPSQTVQATDKASGASLVIQAESGDVPVFSDGAPVAALESFLTLVLGQLIYINEDFNLEPGTLESYSYDTEKDLYYLKLRDGLTFHNNRKATAQDLEYSILRGFYSTKKNWWPSFLGNIDGLDAVKPGMTYKSGLVSGIKVVDERTLSINLKNPNPSFLHSLARSYFSLVPKEELKPDHISWKKYPVGVGEYKVTGFSKSENKVELALVADSPEKPKSITFNGKVVSQPDVVIGNSSSHTGYSTQQLKRASKIVTLFFNYKSPLGQNEDFRKAIDFAMDRKDLSNGHSNLKPTFHIVPRHIWGRKRVDESFSVESAKVHIKNLKAELKKSSQEDLLNKTYRIPVYKAHAKNLRGQNYLQRLQAKLSMIGLKVEFYSSDKKTSKEDFSEIPFRISSLGADAIDPLVQYSLFSGRSFLYPQYPQNDKAFEKLLNTAAKAKSIDTRALSVQKITEHFYNTRMALPLFEATAQVLVKNNRFTSLGQQDGGITFYADRVQLKPEASNVQ